MEDFYYAGGLPAVLRELGENNLLHRDALTVNGRTIWRTTRTRRAGNRDVIHAFKSPFKKDAGIAVLRGNLCPEGAIIKPSAATPKLMTHRAARWCSRASRTSTAHRRPQARHRRELRDGAQELRPQGLPRHGRGRQHAAAA